MKGAKMPRSVGVMTFTVASSAAVTLVAALLASPSAAVTVEDQPGATPTSSASASPSPSPSGSAGEPTLPISPTKPIKPTKPVAATRTTKAKNVPWYPTKSRLKGKRIVYDKGLMTIWLINAQEKVIARYPVVGRPDRPPVGVHEVFSKSERSMNPDLQLKFNNMVRFYRSTGGVAIGFHDIPTTYAGVPIHGPDKLGLPLGIGGCVRMTTEASAKVYRFAKVGTRVEVL